MFFKNMEHNDLSQKVVERIKKIGIKPLSKSVIVTKRFWFWFMASLAVLVGSVSFSVTLFMLCNHDWFLQEKFGFGFIVQSLPYFWFVCLIPLSVWGGFYYRKTDTGYRHSFFSVVGVYIIITVFAGSVIHFVGMSEMVEKTLTERVPVYREVVFDRNAFWSNPKEGLLSGEIVFVGEDFVSVEDREGLVWDVDIKKSLISKRVLLQEGEIIKISGVMSGDQKFEAEGLYPWKGGRLKKDCSR